MSEPSTTAPPVSRPIIGRPEGRGGERYLAIDLGAESGRALVGRFDGERLEIAEVHRFANTPVQLPDSLYWDVLTLYRETLESIRAGLVTGPLASAGIDGWAVDYGLLDHDGGLLGNPLHYRNPRFEAMVAELTRRVGAAELYRRTGIQSLPINTSCQLLAQSGSAVLAAADRLLLVPDLLRFWLTGEATAELTNASTTQLLGAGRPEWDPVLLDVVGVSAGLLPPIVGPGTPSGAVRGQASEAVGSAVPIVTVASHDTASAVAAIPSQSATFGYISSGTWSLVGVERREPTLNEAARLANLTNERGIDGTFRLLKNVMGLWLLQECRRIWAHGRPALTYAELGELASTAPTFGPVFDVGDVRLIAPGDMPARIRRLCVEIGESPPESIAATVRCILESLACAHAAAFDAVTRASGQPVNVIHIVGGGSHNDLLCQLTADATGLPVLAGPAEATAIGNLLVQAMATGRVASVGELREVVARSTVLSTFQPTQRSGDHDRWSELRARYAALTASPTGATMAAGSAAREVAPG